MSPQYDYSCPNGHDYTEFLSIAEYQTQTHCPECKEPGTKVFLPSKKEPSFSEKLYPYFDPNLGRVCHTPKHREQIMKQMGVYSMEGRRTTNLRQERYLLQHRMHLKGAKGYKGAY